MKPVKPIFLKSKDEVENSDVTYGFISFDSGSDLEVYKLADESKHIEIGVGEKKDVSLRKLHLLVRKVVMIARKKKVKNLVIHFEDFIFPNIELSESQLAELIGVNVDTANWEFVKYKQEPKDGWNFIENLYIIGKTSASVKKGFEKGQIVAAEVNACRILANTPGGDMTPTVLAKDAQDAAKGTDVKVKVLGMPELKKHKMGAILGVARGSHEEPKFIIMEYMNGGNKKPIVLVGKGVTFDTGGYDLKPSGSMLEMHMDMSGGASVIHTIVAAAKLGIKKNIVALIPSAENMVSGEGYRPGDILKSMSGKTIEVGNTDAEGRLLLADALEYAKRYEPKQVIDVATLTGAALVALGQRASAIFSSDDSIIEKSYEAAEIAGDYVWRLPLWDEFDAEMKGTFADLRNVSSRGRYGGSITAATFLHQFAKDYPWMHIDMAPRMTAVDDEFFAKGAIGAPVRFLLKLIEKL